MRLKEDNCAKSISRNLSGRLAQTMSALVEVTDVPDKNSLVFAGLPMFYRRCVKEY